MVDYTPVRIALAAVVLDTPDRSGQFFAADAVGGWSYLITDQAGDYRYRGDGSCPGGLDTALRWAILAALDQVQEFQRIHLLFPNRQTHAVANRLSLRDDLVTSAMAGRVLGLLVRPEDRSVLRATAAAEQAAAILLRDRARSEKLDEAEGRAPPLRAGAERHEPAERIGMDEWRAARIERAAASALRGVPQAPGARPLVAAAAGARIAPQPAGLARAVMPFMEGLRERLSGAGVPGLRRRQGGSPAIASWMSDFDSQVAAVQSHLEGVGA